MDDFYSSFRILKSLQVNDVLIHKLDWARKNSCTYKVMGHDYKNWGDSETLYVKCAHKYQGDDYYYYDWENHGWEKIDVWRILKDFKLWTYGNDKIRKVING